jgi:glycosyltransferase involved in cell wall biosynthesis
MTNGARPLAILHVFRAPVGGLFRHVVDLVRGQVAAGHRVGIVADASTGGSRAEPTLAELAPLLALGMTRVPMSRHLGLRDVTAVRRVAQVIAASGADVIHGHGAKGGAYARLVSNRALRAYTPHGGSLHFHPRSPIGFIYLTLERALLPRTDLILFESAYARDIYHARIGTRAAPVRVIHNGVAAAEFTPVTPAMDARDVVFVGELRRLKGVDVLIEALSLLNAGGRPVSATIVGSGPEAAEFQALARTRGLATVTFPGAMPARDAFARGRLLIVPSRAEPGCPCWRPTWAASRKSSARTAIGCCPPGTRPRLPRRSGRRSPIRPRPKLRRKRCANGCAPSSAPRRWSRACWRATARRPSGARLVNTSALKPFLKLFG